MAETHNKTVYECRNVTKQHCTSLWKVEDGKKVWAGNDDCKDVTWEECDAVPVKVEWEVPYMDCIPRDYPYLSYQNITEPVMADTMDCQVEKRTICKPTEIEKCARINYMTCSEVSITSRFCLSELFLVANSNSSIYHLRGFVTHSPSHVTLQHSHV